MIKRQVFFSFEFLKDNWRAAQIRNIGKVSDDSTFSDNLWEEVKYKTDENIKTWINEQLTKRSCIIVLIGETTYSRKWVKYEIEQAYKLGKGMFGIYIHGLKDKYEKQGVKGYNPFDYIYTTNGEKLSKYVITFNLNYSLSKYVYEDISNNIQKLIEFAINNVGNY